MDVKSYSYTGLSGAMTSRLVAQRQRLDQLALAETTGLKSTSYEGIDNRTLTLSFQQKIAQNESYQSAISFIDTRLEMIGNSVDTMNELSNTVAGSLGTNGYQLTSSGKTAEQVAAGNALEGYVATLNTDVDGTFIFAGKASDVSPVVDVTTMIEGDGIHAGFRQIMDERKQADLGSDGLGRLDLSTSGSTVTLAEDGTHSFGFKLTGYVNKLANTTVTGPSGSPASLAVAFTGAPNAGEKIALTVTMPDGSTTDVTLTAGTTADASKGVFAIGATTAATAASFEAVLKSVLEETGKTELTAASASQAANDFFDTAGGGVPQRVAGPPFDTATSMVAGTAADTVTWYRGTNDAGIARQDAQARVADGLTVEYGVRANEDAFASQIKQLAILSTVDVSADTSTARSLWSAVIDRTKGPLEETTGNDSLQSVAAEIAGARKSASNASERMTISSNTYQSAVDLSLKVDDTQLAVEITTLETQIEASYKASSILFKLSLTSYL